MLFHEIFNYRELNMLTKGLELTFVGITAVFVFLTLLVIIMNASYKILQVINRYFPEKEESSSQSGRKAQDINEDIAVAIAAVRAYQKSKGEI